MRINNIIILFFILSGFAVGINLQDSNKELIDSSIDNASMVIENITFDYTIAKNISNSKGLFKIIESGTKFIGILGIETMRAGIYFGKDNPQYFTPEFIIKIIKLIIILIIVSLLIKPIFYVSIFLIMGIIWLVDFIKKKKYIGGKKC